MSVIKDITDKASHWHEPPKVSIYAEDHAEKLTCSICGRKYVSRGKFDPGICRECEREKNAHLVGGPLDGEMANDKN